MFSLQLPWLLLAAPLPWLVYRLWRPLTVQEAALKVPFFTRLTALGAGEMGSAGRGLLPRLLLVLIWLAVLLAAARPVWQGEPVALPASGRDLLLAVDISGSMETPDMEVQGRRLQRVEVLKYVVSDFIERRKHDRIGLILFGTQAYLQAPLTFDRHSVATYLKEAQLGFAGQQTAIGDAIGLAIKRLRSRPESSRVLILLTDGANTAGRIRPRQAAEMAAKAGVKIYTVGLGAEEMIEQTFLGRRRVNPSADLDEDTLRFIADTTGGAYFRARNPEELIQIYSQLDQLEPIEQDAQTYRPIRALFHWPLAAALLASFALAGLDWLRRPGGGMHD